MAKPVKHGLIDGVSAIGGKAAVGAVAGLALITVLGGALAAGAAAYAGAGGLAIAGWAAVGAAASATVGGGWSFTLSYIGAALGALQGLGKVTNENQAFENAKVAHAHVHEKMKATARESAAGEYAALGYQQGIAEGYQMGQMAIVEQMQQQAAAASMVEKHGCKKCDSKVETLKNQREQQASAQPSIA